MSHITLHTGEVIEGQFLRVEQYRISHLFINHRNALVWLRIHADDPHISIPPKEKQYLIENEFLNKDGTFKKGVREVILATTAMEDEEFLVLCDPKSGKILDK